MPLWTIYHSQNALSTAEERDALAADITASYAMLPPFYVAVVFVPLGESQFYRSGKRVSTLDRPFVRIHVSHLARHAADSDEGIEAGYARGRMVVDRAIQKGVVDKGYLWEYSVTEDKRELWKIDGQIPPPFNSEAFQDWRKHDRAAPY